MADRGPGGNGRPRRRMGPRPGARQGGRRGHQPGAAESAIGMLHGPFTATGFVGGRAPTAPPPHGGGSSEGRRTRALWLAGAASRHGNWGDRPVGTPGQMPQPRTPSSRGPPQVWADPAESLGRVSPAQSLSRVQRVGVPVRARGEASHCAALVVSGGGRGLVDSPVVSC